MKKELLLIGISLLFLASCKKNNNEESIIAMNSAKLSLASNIFMKNNTFEIYEGNPFYGIEVYSNYEFELGDYNNDGEADLYAIKKQNTDTDFTEIHILSGASNYTSSLLKIETVLSGIDSNCKFELGDYNNDGKVDLYVIKKQSSDTDIAEIHILSGASNYTSSLLKMETVLNEPYSNYEFQLGDYNDDGKLDVYALNTYSTDTNSTKIHILNGASNYTSFLHKTETVLNDANYEYIDSDYDENVDFYRLKKQNRGVRLTKI